MKNSLQINFLPPSAHELRQQNMPAPEAVAVPDHIRTLSKDPSLFRMAVNELAQSIGEQLVPPLVELNSDRDCRTVPCMQVARAAIDHALGEEALAHELARNSDTTEAAGAPPANALQAQNLTAMVSGERILFMGQ